MEFESGECGSLLFDAAVELGDRRLYAPARRRLQRSRTESGIDGRWLATLKYAVKELHKLPR